MISSDPPKLTSLSCCGRKSNPTFIRGPLIWLSSGANLHFIQPSASAVPSMQRSSRGKYYYSPGHSHHTDSCRKLLLCALERNDLDGAKEALFSMSDVAKEQPMTIYLAHKLAVQGGDWDMAAECIERISQASSSDLKFLYACCLEAHASDDKLSALKALKVLADKHEFNIDSPIHLPALLRVIIRLQMSMLSEGSADIDRELLAEDLCHVFEGGE